MLTKCIRALSMPLAAEHSTRDDILMAAPGELLSIPVHACDQENNPHCQCRRVFVGLQTGQPTTLARVCLVDEAEVDAEASSSGEVVPYVVAGDTGDGVVLHGVKCMAHALRHFEPGTLLRVNRVMDKVYLEDTWKAAAVKMGILPS